MRPENSGRTESEERLQRETLIAVLAIDQIHHLLRCLGHLLREPVRSEVAETSGRS